MSSVLSGLVDFAISFLMFFVMMVYYRIRPTWPMLLVPGFSAARGADGSGRGLVAFGAERDLPRRALRRAVSGAVLDVRFAGGLSQLARAAKVALALRLNPWRA